MGTHPIFESDFDCLTEGEIGLRNDFKESESSQPPTQNIH